MIRNGKRCLQWQLIDCCCVMRLASPSDDDLDVEPPWILIISDKLRCRIAYSMATADLPTPVTNTKNERFSNLDRLQTLMKMLNQ